MKADIRQSLAAMAAGSLIALWWAVLATAASAADRAERGPLRVIVGIAPVAGLVEQVGGDRVQVEVLAASGVCAHQLSLSPKQAQALAKADLLLTINMPFEQQLAERLRQTGSKVRCVDISSVSSVASGVAAPADKEAAPASGDRGSPGAGALQASGESCPHGCSHDHEAASSNPSSNADKPKPAAHAQSSDSSKPPAANHPGDNAAAGRSADAEHGHSCGDPNCREDHHGGQAADPHIWLDPSVLPRLVENIAATLAAADPAGASQFRRNQQALQGRIAELTQRLDEQLRPLAGQSIYVYHPSLGYLCKAYGLRQIAVESDGKAPSAKHLRSLIQQAQAERVRAVFVEPSGDQRAAAAVAQAIGAKVVVFDPMAPDVVKNLAEAAEQICRHQTDR